MMDSSNSFYNDVFKRKAVRVESTFLDFLNSFRLDLESPESLYESETKAMKVKKSTTMFVDFSHVIRFDHFLQETISQEYLRFERYLGNACKQFFMQQNPTEDNFKNDINVAFYNIPLLKRLRDLTTADIGKLVSVTGIVSRTSEVWPELLVGTFECLKCGDIVKNVEQQYKYTKPICSDEVCRNNGGWKLLRQESKFVDWQRVQMQEITKEIPTGSLPQSLDVILRNEIVEQARVGDTVIFTGTLMAIPDIMTLPSPIEIANCRRITFELGHEVEYGDNEVSVRDLSHRFAFIANSVQVGSGERASNVRNANRENDEDDQSQHFTTEEIHEIQAMRNTPDFFNKLVDSIAPTICGHQEIKTAILLMLLGGVHKVTHDGINLRGDINVCIIGDPGCAKSQFLKYTSSLVPRSVYISGKSLSAKGLTATVAEAEDGEFCIEAGPLMLADNGICCIDEFDEIDIKGRVGIHEAMDKQTISITKAGIHVILNARTAILAAANPAGGCYDKSKPLKYNVALPPAILSRFDLVCVMIDEPDYKKDYDIAHHIVRFRRNPEEALSPPFTTAQMKQYIAYAKTLKPKLNLEARGILVENYAALRIYDTAPASRDPCRMTIRHLNSLIRLAEAIARIKLENEVTPDHVRGAFKHLKTTIINFESIEIDLSDFQEDGNGDHRDSGEASGKVADNQQREKLVITEEHFNRVAESLIMRLRQHEDFVADDGSGLIGMKQSDLIFWYVKQQKEQGAYNSSKEAEKEVKIIKAIIKKLIAVEGYLIVIDGGKGSTAEGEERQPSSSENRILAVAPNYTLY